MSIALDPRSPIAGTATSSNLNVPAAGRPTPSTTAGTGLVHRCGRTHPLAPLAWSDQAGAQPDPAHTGGRHREGEGKHRGGQIGGEAGEGVDCTGDLRIRSRQSDHRLCVGATG